MRIETLRGRLGLSSKRFVSIVALLVATLTSFAFGSSERANADPDQSGINYSSWESLGGVGLGTPATTTWGVGRLDLFVRGRDDNLWHKWYSNGWSVWENLGAPPGGAASDPASVAWSPGRIDVFVRGTDNQLWHKWYDGGWSGWESLGGALVGAPAVSSWENGRLDVFARGTDNHLWHKFYDLAGGWFGGWEPLGGFLNASPAAISWGDGRIDVFVSGGDNQLWHKWFNRSDGWSNWEALGGTLVGGPGVSSWSPGRLDVFVRGADNNLWHQWFSTAWSGWQLGVAGHIGSSPSAISWGPNRVDVFVLGSDQSIIHTFGLAYYFGPGTYRVGVDIPAGTYRTRIPSQGCYWARLSGFSGQQSDIIANNLTDWQDVVTILPSDAGFQTDSCELWTSDLSTITGSLTAPFLDGKYIIGTDVAAGTWQAPGGSNCYWARLSGFSDPNGNQIIANNFGAGQQVVTISAGDAGFETDSCGTWTKVG